jgi:hypothetical protein
MGMANQKRMKTASPSSLHHLRRFGCYIYKRIPKEQRIDSKMGARSNPAMMVGYVHNSTTLWKVYNFDYQKVVQWSDAIFDEERNAYTSFPNGTKRDRRY